MDNERKIAVYETHNGATLRVYSIRNTIRVTVTDSMGVYKGRAILRNGKLKESITTGISQLVETI